MRCANLGVGGWGSRMFRKPCVGIIGTGESDWDERNGKNTGVTREDNNVLIPVEDLTEKGMKLSR
jgi:hypothetical protein